MSPHSQNIIQNLGWIANIFQAFAVLSGVSLMCVGFFELKRYGESRSHMSQQGSIAGPLATLIAGICFLILPTFIGTALHAFWGQYSPFSWSSSGGNDWDGCIKVIQVFVRLVGVGSMMRGIFLLSKLGKQGGQQQGGVGKALIHIFAAILCINIAGTVQLFESILDISF